MPPPHAQTRDVISATRVQEVTDGKTCWTCSFPSYTKPSRIRHTCCDRRSTLLRFEATFSRAYATRHTLPPARVQRNLLPCLRTSCCSCYEWANSAPPGVIMTAAVDGRPGGMSGARPTGASHNNGDGEKAFEHIQDLQRKARSGYNPQGSIGQLLDAATRGLAQAQTLLDFRRPDLSYIEYLRVSEIVVVDIPRNKEWPQFQVDHGGGKALQDYRVLQRRVNALNERYASIKDIIVNNNKRSGVQPTGTNGVNGHARAESVPQHSINGYGANGHMSSQKVRPTPSPKPEALHGRAVSTATATMPPSQGADLSSRFAKLRTHDIRPESRGSTASSVHSSPVSMARSEDYDGRSSFESLSRISSNSSSRPYGPRGMPSANPGPPLPGKLPLNTGLAAAMPKEPSPTYSPARNMQTTGNIAPPRHSARSMVSSSARRASGVPSSASSASSHAPNGAYASSDYFPSSTTTRPPPSNAQSPAQLPRRQSVNVPLETRISNERLYDYLERFNVLLVDFRSREEYDQGHIYARSIICIDPLSVQQGMSAEQLLERMVLSPEIEQHTFMLRDKYDLVVYYDNDTQSESYLSRPQSEKQAKLKYLHEALHDFNQDKPLPRPPILLIGGLAAWVDLVGNQALMTSNTAARMKQGRPLQRRPPASPNGMSQLRMPKRRLRDYNPMDADEEKQWRERARAESVVLPAPTTMTEENGVLTEEPEGGDGEDPGSAIKEFLERFPEAGSLDRQAFGPLQPSRTAPAPPEVPAKLPHYPAAPQPSQYPSVPARPPPAAPRMSYTGVSDRAASHNAPPTRSSSLVPYIPPKYLATNLRLPKTGLYNFGATCYMNAMIQALSATTPLSILFLDDGYRGLIQHDNWKGSKSRLLPEFFSNLIRSLWKGDVTFIKPTTFRRYCGTLSDTFAGNDQQDAKEFFDVIVDALHEDLNLNWRKPPLKDLTTAEEAHRERMPKHLVAKLEWGRYTHREHSFITNLFAGQHYSQLRFPACGHTSTKYEAFYSISVEIPRPRDPRSRVCPTLDDCLRSYCQEEILSGEDQVKCEVCGEFRDAVKQITITRAPQFLVVHFKRFGYSRTAQKIHTPVNFPLANLDITPYMLPQPSGADQKYIESNFSQFATPEPAMTPPYAYDAYAVVRHHGRTLESGHYTAYVKDRARGVWRYFDDQRTGDFQPGQGRFSGEGDLRNSEAYVVFYSRVQGQQGQVGGVGPGGVGRI